MTEEKTTYDMQTILFTQLVLSFQASAMQQMGKVMNIFTHKIERDLAQAQMSIDMLSMLQEKTKGNLATEESRLLDRVLFELRMNYLDEVEKDKENKGREKVADDTHIGKNQEEEEGPPEAAMAGETADLKETGEMADRQEQAQPGPKKRRPSHSAKKGQADPQK